MNISVQITLRRWKSLKNGYGPKYVAEKSRENLRLFLCLLWGKFKQKDTKVCIKLVNNHKKLQINMF